MHDPQSGSALASPVTRAARTLSKLTKIAWIITALGVAMTLLATMSSLDALWLLSGILLVLTGIVKIVMLQIWTRLAKLGTDEHQPINAP